MNNDETIAALLPAGLQPLYGKGFEEVSGEYTDLVSYAHRLVVRTGRIPPIALAFEAFNTQEIPIAFVIDDEITVHGVTVKVLDYETDVQPGFGARGPVNVWTVYVDEVDG